MKRISASLLFVFSMTSFAHADIATESLVQTLERIAGSYTTQECYHIEELNFAEMGLEEYFSIGTINEEDDYEGFGSTLKVLYKDKKGKPFVADYSEGESVCLLSQR